MTPAGQAPGSHPAIQPSSHPAIQPSSHPAGLSLRRAGASDAAAVATLVTAAYRHYIERIGTVPGPMRADYDQVIRDHHVTVAERAGSIVGVISAS